MSQVGYTNIICHAANLSATNTYPQRKPNGIQDAGNNKVPANTMDSNFMSRLKPLVDYETSQKDVDNRPDIKDPMSYGVEREQCKKT